MIRERGRVRPLVVLAVLLFCLALLRPAEAGKGIYEKIGSTGRGELDLVVYFVEKPEGDLKEGLSDWEPVFEKYAELLYDATEGQVRLRKVTFTTDESLKYTADIRVLAGTGLASAHLRGFGRLNQCISITQTHKSHLPPTLGQFGLMHESGHYLFGLYDEYLGCHHEAGDKTCLEEEITRNARSFYCSRGGRRGNTAASIMDGGSSVGPENLRREFCVGHIINGEYQHRGPRTARTGSGEIVVNLQELVHGMSCWDTMASKESALRLNPISYGTLPQTQNLRVDHLSMPRQGLPEFVHIDSKLGIVMVLDQSASMGQPASEGAPTTSLALLKNGARDAIDYMADDERFGMVTFGAAVEAEAVPFQGVASARAPAEGVIDGMAAGGQTSMGTALRAGFDMVSEAAVPVSEVSGRTIILLSDGLSNGGESPQSVLRDLRGEPLITVHTIALGSQADRALLQQIARETGGSFFSITDPDRVPGVLPQIISFARGESSVFEFIDQLGPGSTANFPAEVSAGTTEATFLLTYPQGSELRLTLLMPSGKQLFLDGEDVCVVPAGGAFDPSTDPCVSEGITYQQDGEQRLYRVPNAEQGAWQITVTRPALPPGQFGEAVEFQFRLIAQSRDVAVSAEIVNKDSRITYSEPIRVEVSVYADGAVGGVAVSGQVHHPDGSIDGDEAGEDGIVLFDDGLRMHGDRDANDGVYSGLYSNFKVGGNGAYRFKLKAVNETGYKVRTGEASDAALEREFVPPFVVSAETTALVRGVPERFSLGTIDITGPGELVVEEVDARNLSLTPVLRFRVKASKEHVNLDSLTIRSVGDGDETSLDELGLFLDSDKDGVIDNPTNPRARAVFDADDGEAVFRSPDVIASIPAGATWHFIVTFGSLDAPPLDDPDDAWGPLLRRPPPLPVGMPVLFAFLLALALLALSVLARRPRPAARPVGPCLCLILSALLVGVVGCGGGGGDPPNPDPGDLPNPIVKGAYDVTLDPADLQGVGGIMGETIAGRGESVQTILTVK